MQILIDCQPQNYLQTGRWVDGHTLALIAYSASMMDRRLAFTYLRVFDKTVTVTRVKERPIRWKNRERVVIAYLKLPRRFGSMGVVSRDGVQQ